MPEPQQGETRQDFVQRCIPIVLEDGTANDSDQAVAVCNSMWEQAMSDNNRVEFIYIPDNFVTVTPGEPIKLFPLQSIFKNGVERSADLIAKLKLPHFKPAIKRGSHDDDAPALGHITDLYTKDGWLWGVPEWVGEGLKNLQEGSFRYLSPEVIWEGEMEDSTTGEMIAGPLLVGAAALHMPALGEAASFYSVEATEVDMAENTQDVAWYQSALDKALDAMGRKQATPQDDPPPQQVDKDSVEKYEAAQAEIEQLKAEIAEQKSKEERGQRVAHFAAEFKEAPAVAEDKAVHELLADLPEEQAELFATKLKALSAQIDESKLMGSPGGGEPGDPPGSDEAYHEAIEAYANEHKVSYGAAAAAVAKEQPELYKAWGGR